MSGKRILIIDDSENIRTTLKLTLEFKDCTVCEAEDGEEGLRILREQDFDLVFCDLAMPGLSGEEVIAGIRREPGKEQVPIIVVSAEDRASKNRALEAGATDFIDKPFYPESILALVERHGVS